ncbi:MAG: hypothetical protein HY784_00945, partial [Chloroflexi bacterium]|nr:hypothetical protein [Chloroflexota bacterium]
MADDFRNGWPASTGIGGRDGPEYAGGWKMKKNLLLLLVAPLLLVFMVVNAQAVPLLTNGGFETGDMTGWTATPNVSVLGSHFGVNPSEGSYMAVLAPVGWFDASLSQSFSPAGFTTAHISFDYNLQGLDITPLWDFGADSLTVSIDSLVLLTVPLNDVYRGGSTVLGWQTFDLTVIRPLGLPPG